MLKTVRELTYGRYRLRLGERTLVMGILNVTPDSFSGDGLLRHPDPVEAALSRAQDMVAAGADLLDVGGESTRPGADPVPLEEELRRVIPVIEALSTAVDVPISVDTQKSEVARRALRAGAWMVNDTSALRADPEMVRVVAEFGCPVVLMHMKGTPKDMQRDPRYGDVVGEVRAFLAERIAFAQRHGIPRERIVVDPGFGFGKRPEHNLEVVRRLAELQTLECPILIGPSRKSTIGRILQGAPPRERVEGTIALCVLSAAAGADLVRVHDVQAVVRAMRVADAVLRGWRDPEV
ncbi:MAG: dihydropteroate synthase [Armatimonadetes bacterium]|nr:dihydropteroate synthase [Armatimonadota bacterium]MDW8154125.1 dihydropteroate synthase [Armatimonadota bacterium]